jgi:hypothetical protein
MNQNDQIEVDVPFFVAMSHPGHLVDWTVSRNTSSNNMIPAQQIAAMCATRPQNTGSNCVGETVSSAPIMQPAYLISDVAETLLSPA